MRAGNKLLTLLLVCMLLCSGCARNNGKTEPSETSDKQSVSDRAVTTESRELFAMDTVMDITLYRTGQTDQPLRTCLCWEIGIGDDQLIPMSHIAQHLQEVAG